MFLSANFRAAILSTIDAIAVVVLFQERVMALDGDSISAKDQWMAQKCVDCKLCSYARGKQKGVLFWIVKNIEPRICPFCRAYERVYGRKAHEALPDDVTPPPA